MSPIISGSTQVNAAMAGNFRGVKRQLAVGLSFTRQHWKFSGVCVGLLASLALFILAGIYSTFPGDRGVIEGLQNQQSGWLDAAALNITRLGGWIATGALMFGLIGYLAYHRRRIDAIIVLLSSVPMLIGFVLKEVVGRTRPDLLIAGSEPSSLSFPSGHAVFAIIFGGLLIFLAGQLIKSVGIRRSVQIGLGLLILAIGVSRVYLGFHWPSDVVGGYMFGAMALMGLLWLRHRLMLRQSKLVRFAA